MTTSDTPRTAAINGLAPDHPERYSRLFCLSRMLERENARLRQALETCIEYATSTTVVQEVASAALREAQT